MRSPSPRRPTRTTPLGILLASMMQGLALMTALAIWVGPVQAQDSWSEKAPMPTPRAHMAVGVVNDVVYVIGGFVGPGLPPLTTVEAYNATTNTWATKTPMPTRRGNTAAGVVNGIIYVVGGQDFQNNCCIVDLATLEAYDPAADTWTTKASMPTPRYDSAVAVVNGILYVVGGIAGATSVATVEAYDPTTDSWTTKASLPIPLGGPGAASLSGVLYSFGGIVEGCTISS